MSGARGRVREGVRPNDVFVVALLVSTSDGDGGGGGGGGGGVLFWWNWSRRSYRAEFAIYFVSMSVWVSV